MKNNESNINSSMILSLKGHGFLCLINRIIHASILIYFLFAVLFPAKAQWEWQNPLPQGDHQKIVCFPVVDTGYILLDCSRTILKTTDGGLNWKNHFRFTNPNAVYLLSMFFTDANTGFAVGWGGKIFKTIDGASSWFELQSFTNSQLHSVSFIDDNIGFAVGENGVIIKTINGGNTWVNCLSGFSDYLFSVFFVNNSIGFAVGTGGTILKTINGGETWIELISGTFSTLLSVHFANENIGCVVGENGTILSTHNGGLTWNIQTVESNYFLNSVVFLNANNGVIVGGDFFGFSIALNTSDGGQTWSTHYHTADSRLFSLAIIENETVLAVGNNGRIIKTTNGGETWSEVSKGVLSHFNSVFFVNDSTGFVVGKIMSKT